VKVSHRVVPGRTEAAARLGLGVGAGPAAREQLLDAHLHVEAQLVVDVAGRPGGAPHVEAKGATYARWEPAQHRHPLTARAAAR
jgi:hypothetical protein